MSLRINLNSAAMTAHRMLAGTDESLGKSIERLSSGFKINNAGDDPAGLVVSEKLRAQVSGLGQAIRNAGDAVNMVKTAEGALGEVNRLLRSMRDLAVHAANTGVTDPAAAAADQAQIINACESINKIASETQFGDKRLLNGSAGISTVVTGSSTVSANFSDSGLTEGISFYVKTTQAATQAALTSTVDLADVTDVMSITINGIDITTGNGSAATLTAINARANETGVVATDVGGKLVLTQKEYGSTARIDVTNGTNVFGPASAAAVGADVRADVSQDAAYLNKINASAGELAWASGTGLTLKDSLGNTIVLTQAAATEAISGKGLQGTIEVGELVFQVGAYRDQTRSLQIGSVAAANLGRNATDVTSFNNLSEINVTTNAQEAIGVLDKAIADISGLRADLGATQKNVLESSINSLTVAKENIAASESSIRDTDMAAEMVEFTRNQIMQQAGTAMLAQANQAPQTLLALLK